MALASDEFRRISEELREMNQSRPMSVLDICLDLHTSKTGASDPLPDKRQCEFLDWLEIRFRDWRPSSPGTLSFDEAVRELVRVTLVEHGRNEWSNIWF